MEKNIKLTPIIIGLLSCLLFFNSCGSSNKISYFTNVLKDSTGVVTPTNSTSTINKNDILQITVSSPDPQTTLLFNGISSSSSNSTANAAGLLNGYLVDESGVIKLPLLGSIKAVGLTKSELSNKIVNELTEKKLAVDPIVTIRIINYKITVLGEVNHPGVIPVPNELITLPEALGLAGDLTLYARRDRVLLIREIDGKRVFKRFNLSNGQFFNNDIYYLKNNDIIYVDPEKAKAATKDRTVQFLPIIISALSLTIILLRK
ncbi:polysaccharide biosynthesis/export family protein [Mucilaginibacter sp. RCC_168]|uniref:polysaccharide biosynthesis/export family protein n=1 Tax=Mucilaginibacter sp. RCC_168 TaxID=3239221 RepID=UPI003525A2CE